MPSERNQKKNVHYVRKKNGLGQEPAPNTVDGWEVPQNIQSFPDNTGFMQWDSVIDEPDLPRILMFSTDQMVERAGRCRHFFSDGKFSDIPVFEQLYTVHGELVCLIYISNF